MEIYRDAGRTPEARASDLILRMTLDEKIAQLGAIWSFEVLEDGEFSPAKAGALLKEGIGHICRPGVGTALPPAEIAHFLNEAQRFLIANTRLGIPAMVHEECLSGFMTSGAAVFPQMIGMASTWQPELLERIANVIRGQMRAVGVHQGLGPVLDVSRDPRWGRVEETFGEDPYLVAEMGTAYVKGLQGADLRDGVIATLKHFAGYSMSEGGLNWAPAHIPSRLLREVYLYPFKEVITRSRALAVMNGYQEIDGMPCAASQELLTDILRNEWGFDGMVVSDYFAIENLHSYHRIAEDKAEAAGLALAAGIDAELPKSDCYGEPLKERVKKGSITEELIDRAVLRVLESKLRLGLFDDPYVKTGQDATIFDMPEHRRLALEAARRSLVLLKNQEDLLPLDRNSRTIALIGPNADNARNLLGDYTYAAHIDLVAMMATALGTPLQMSDSEGDRIGVRVVTVKEGVQARVSPQTKVLYAQGCAVSDTEGSGFAEAVEMARQAEAAVVVVGGKSGLTLDCTCGEMRDSAELCLPAVQGDLVRAVYETGTPVVLVIVNGRPLALGWMAEQIPAIIQAWLPGEEGGNAIADVLLGEFNPGGKLPVSIPETVGQVPIYYGHKPSGARSQVWGDYVDAGTSPAFEFGHGLSYTTFEMSNLRIEPARIGEQGTLSVQVDVRNTGNRPGEEVVQLYINDVFASVTRPVKELKGFSRIALQVDETGAVEFELPVEALAFYDRDMRLTVEPGTFKVMIGRSSCDIALEGEFEILPQVAQFRS